MNTESEADASLRRLNEELPSDLEQEIKFTGYLLQAQRISAEILSNMICSPDDEAFEDVDDKSDAESVQDYDGQNGNGSNASADKISAEAAEVLKAHNVVEKVSMNSFKFLKQFHMESANQFLTMNGPALHLWKSKVHLATNFSEPPLGLF